jgi:hypothetical protein
MLYVAESRFQFTCHARRNCICQCASVCSLHHACPCRQLSINVAYDAGVLASFTCRRDEIERYLMVCVRARKKKKADGCSTAAYSLIVA